MEGRWTLMKDDELSSVTSTLAVSACTGPSEVDLHIMISLTRKRVLSVTTVEKMNAKLL